MSHKKTLRNKTKTKFSPRGFLRGFNVAKKRSDQVLPRKQKTVLVGGGFDLLHYGHIKTLELAATLGDKLIVNLLSDARLKEKKGDERPIIPEAERIALIMAVRWVTGYVCLSGDKDYPFYKVVEMVHPDVVVVNEDEYASYIEEEAFCEARHIALVRVPRINAPSGLDTTSIIKKIRQQGKS